MMRIQFACLLLVLVLAPVLAQDANIKRRYNKFKKQHIYEQMTVNKCNEVMQKRKINTNECKETNTFIRANINLVRSICVRDGEPYGEMTRSLKPFDIVVCSLKTPGAKSPDCQYHGKALTRRIIIKCVRGFPVHYDGDIGHCEN